MPQAILVVDDEPVIREAVHYMLTREGYVVYTARDGEEALEMARKKGPDLIVLDVILPKVDGWSVCQQLRQEGITVPILMLTARSEEVDRVLGLEVGADDYLPKPFSMRELLARIRALLRRVSWDAGQRGHRIEIGAIHLDPKARRVTVDGEEVSLNRKEFDLLFLLMSRAGEALERREILRRIWGEEYYDPRLLDVYIHVLRKKLEPDPKRPRYIQTVWGVGYRFVTPEELEEDG